ncbi:MAG: uracil-DNA glycosylase family protein, partial [Holophagaceae bacterium]
FRLRVPIIATVIGEGGSGGALGIGVADRLLMFEHSVYTVASPEACASILWRDAAKAPAAAEALKITGPDLLQLGVIDTVLPEPAGGNHWAPLQAAATLTDLQCTIEGCLACPLGPGRMKFVFGEGDPAARLMFVGEGPGRDEDLQGRPFVGKAGELLDKMIGALGLTREATYIANIVKCRPPDNRTPTPEEARTCLGYLHRQIELIRPDVIVTLGATPLRELAGITEGITKMRGQWQRIQVGGREIPLMPTFHPAYVLRQYTQDVRRAVWQDLQAAKEWLDRPADS